jgi:hypothetical protein
VIDERPTRAGKCSLPRLEFFQTAAQCRFFAP